jgi:hypothetical protein
MSHWKSLPGGDNSANLDLFPLLVAGQGSAECPMRGYLIALVVVLFFGLPAPAGFFTAPSYPAGASPWTVAVADFNGDGIPDLVVANYPSDKNAAGVSILLGNGDGTFRAPQSQLFGADTYALAVGDFNGDGYPDVAATGLDNSGRGTLAILLGNGDGTLQAPQVTVLPNSESSFSVAVGDFNQHNGLDLVVGLPDGVNLLLGNGDGTFQAPQPIAPGAGGLVVTDLNGDGYPDIAGASGDAVIILLSNGDGTFQPGQSYPIDGEWAWAIAVADLNGDGIPDLAVAFRGDGFGLTAGLSILLGNGDGTFQAPQSSLVGTFPYSLAVGDFNGDGYPDLVMADIRSVYIFLGNGDGTFKVPVLYAANGFPLSVAVGDFYSQGTLDLALATASTSTVTIMHGHGDGAFAAARSYWSGGALLGGSTIATGDFNGDGIPDLVVANSDSWCATILLGNGDGSFQAPQSYPAGSFPAAATVGDFNGDGILDIALSNISISFPGTPSTVSVLLGNGDGSFQAPLASPAGYGPGPLMAGDFNGDGKLDLVTANFAEFSEPRHPPIILENGLRILLGNGDGTFQPPQAYPLSPNDSSPQAVVAADFTGNGILDLAVPNLNANTVSLLLGNGDGTFQPAVNHPVGNSPQALTVGDFNGDGHLDMAVIAGEGLTMLLGRGDGTFARHDMALGNLGSSLAAADFNGDGILDLAVAVGPDLVGHGLNLLLGNGDGTFQPPQYYAAGSSGSLVVADFNGDGWPDVALSNSATILLNQP